jgi:BRO domain-containing protein
MQNDIMTIENVRGYVDENNVAYLNLEDVARGLGWVKTEIKNGKEYESIRKARILNYLEDISFFDHLWAKGLKPDVNSLPEYIPENIFYKLCMKASNPLARLFQDKVADEILPEIRKKGYYVSEKATKTKEEEILDSILRKPVNPSNLSEAAFREDIALKRGSLLYEISKTMPSEFLQEKVKSQAINILSGNKTIQLIGEDIPQTAKIEILPDTYTATEILQMIEEKYGIDLGCSKVGSCANRFGLKTDENGYWHFKEDYGNVAFRYYPHMVDKIVEFIVNDEKLVKRYGISQFAQKYLNINPVEILESNNNENISGETISEPAYTSREIAAMINEKYGTDVTYSKVENWTKRFRLHKDEFGYWKQRDGSKFKDFMYYGVMVDKIVAYLLNDDSLVKRHNLDELKTRFYSGEFENSDD